MAAVTRRIAKMTPRGRRSATVPVIAGAPATSGRLRDKQLTGVGHDPRKTSRIHHRFQMFGVGLVLGGHGTYRVGDGPVREIVPPCAFVVYPGPIFDYGPDEGTTWEERHVCVVGPGVSRWIEAGWVWRGDEPRQVGDTSVAVALHNELLTYLRRGQPGDSDRAMLTAERFLMELYYAQKRSRHGSAPHASIHRVIEDLRTHHCDALDLRAIARRHSMSYSHLRQQVRRHTGLPPAKYVTRLRCDTAGRLLTDTDMSVKEVASQVGFTDAFTFSRTFKRQVGHSPLRHRQRARL
ncbi:MAG: helix-turn-helix domain-containing protein [Phycisphaera sp.]|nr:helix-turn-helix domain-containing protein [Phycisphaera sp.]